MKVRTATCLCCALAALLLAPDTKAQDIQVNINLHERGNGLFFSGKWNASQTLNWLTGKELEGESAFEWKLRIADPTFDLHGTLHLQGTSEYSQNHQYKGQLVWQDPRFIKKVGLLDRKEVLEFMAKTPNAFEFHRTHLTYNLNLPAKDDPFVGYLQALAPASTPTGMLSRKTLFHFGLGVLERWSFKVKPLFEYKNLRQDPNLRMEFELADTGWLLKTNGAPFQMQQISGKMTPGHRWVATHQKGTEIECMVLRPGSPWEMGLACMALLLPLGFRRGKKATP